MSWRWVVASTWPTVTESLSYATWDSSCLNMPSSISGTTYPSNKKSISRLYFTHFRFFCHYWKLFVIFIFQSHSWKQEWHMLLSWVFVSSVTTRVLIFLSPTGKFNAVGCRRYTWPSFRAPLCKRQGKYVPECVECELLKRMMNFKNLSQVCVSELACAVLLLSLILYFRVFSTVP